MLSKHTIVWGLRDGVQCRRIGASYKSFQKFATQAEVKRNETATVDINLENARPFEEVPGPSTFGFIRSLLPGGGFHEKSIFDMINGLQNEHGPLFRMPGLGRPDIYMDLNPDDYPVIFRNEGQWPERRSFDTLVYYREVYRRDIFQGVEGILATSGEKWAKVRTPVNPVLLQPKNAKLYINTMQEASEEFLTRIREIRDPVTQEVPDNFVDEVNRLAFESVAAVALNTKIGLLRNNRDTAEAKNIIRSLLRLFELAFELDMLPPIWKYVPTPKFKEIMNIMDMFTDLCNKYINEAFARIEQDPEGKLSSLAGSEKSVLEKLLLIDKRIAVATALDMLFAGVETTSSTLTGIMFCLSKNPEKQEKLLQEIKQILPEKNSRFTIENMRNLPYLRACIKEGMRIYPIAPGTSRCMPHDVVLSGYCIPKGSHVFIASSSLLHNEKYVPRPSEFLPERWLRKDDNTMKGNLAGVFLPFGFGPRSCAGRRIVELEMELALAHLVRNFNIGFNYPLDNPFKAKLFSVPSIPLKFRFEERKQ